MRNPPKRSTILLLSFFICLAFVLPGRNSHPQTPVVRAVLFYRGSCSHCVELVNLVMPPILDKYGESLQIFYCDVSTPAGDALFTTAIDEFHIQTIGVPTVIVGEAVLIGSRNIEQKFPGMIEAGLSSGGLDWPDIPGLQPAFAAAGSMTLPALGNVIGPSDLLPLLAGTEAAPSAPAAADTNGRPAWMRRFLQDPRGNSLAVVVLLGMVGVMGYGIFTLLMNLDDLVGARYIVPLRTGWAQNLVPMLSIMGIGISTYLAYVEITLAEVICGPVGNCNAVQGSPYARLFGIVPVGLTGVAGYAAILAAWLVRRWARGRAAQWAGWMLFGLTLGGLGFSIYLTFLEPFVIGATCLWCLASAVVMTALFLLNLGRRSVRA